MLFFFTIEKATEFLAEHRGCYEKKNRFTFSPRDIHSNSKNKGEVTQFFHHVLAFLSWGGFWQRTATQKTK